MKNIRTIKNISYDCFIDYIPKCLIQGVSDFKDKIISIFNTNTPKQTLHGRGKKLSKPKKQNVKEPLISKKNKKELKIEYLEIFGHFVRQKKKKKKEINKRKKNIIKDYLKTE